VRQERHDGRTTASRDGSVALQRRRAQQDLGYRGQHVRHGGQVYITTFQNLRSLFIILAIRLLEQSIQ
jgi:starvation-inducible outer membrane lipoprotein